MIEIVEVVRRETAVIARPGGSEKIVIERPPVLQVVEVVKQGPRGRPGDPGPAGVYDGAVAESSPDPVLLFENALI